MYKHLPALSLVLLVLLSTASSAFYILPEGHQAIVTQFGRPVGVAHSEAGLKFKIPFIQEARLLDKRVLNWDGKPNQIPTKDKKYIYVDTTARWKIVDPLLFIKTVQTEKNALSRIDSIMEDATRDTISGHNLVEAVRNSNALVKEKAAAVALAASRQALAESGAAPDGSKEAVLNQVMEEEEVMGEFEPVEVGREKLSAMIAQKASENMKGLGIQLIDVQLRRIAYEESVERKVYERMISERQRIAEKIRSVGKGEQAKIRGKTNQDLQEIESSAYRTVQEIRGNAEATAIKIYSDAIGENKEFYQFIRTLEAYRKGLKPNTRMILSSDSDFLRLLKQGESGSAPTAAP